MAPPTPSWVAPSARQLADCAALVETDGGEYAAGVVRTLEWLDAAGPSPVTGEALDASRAAAEAEFFAAGSVELGGSPLSVVIPPATAQGAGRTLAWLLGWDPHPPVDLPRRPVPTAEQLYEEAVAAEPWRYDLPEAQAAARLTARAEAARLAALADRADGA